MSQERVGLPPAGQPAWERAVSKMSAYARLGKLNIWQIYLTLPVAWTLLPRSVAFSPHGMVTILLFLLCVVGVVSAALALDDVVGYRIGMDEVTYGSTEELLRSSQMKPLLSGELSAAEAVRYGWVAAAVGIVSGLTAILISWRPSSPWALLGFVVVVFLTLQYSYGLGFTFRVFGASESILIIGFAAAVALPYGVSTGTLSARVLVEAILVALSMLQVGMFSNSADAPHDREYGRTSVAARVGDIANRTFIVGVFVAAWALTVSGIVAGWLTPWLAVALVPAWLVQIFQLREGVALRRWLRARKLGFHAYELVLLALIVTNALAWLR
jgi:1,4-dihydroxy-2-naphthoate polyprenyltransferase